MKNVFYLMGLLLILCFILSNINTSLFAADVDKIIENNVKKMKSQYLSSNKKLLDVKWAPKVDENFSTNSTYCRSNIGHKIENIGKLSCPGNNMIKYTINKGQVKIHLLYSIMMGNLSLVVIESTDSNPKRKYLYNVEYPNAKLDKLSIIFKDNSMMAFKPDGKLNVYVYDDNTSCKTENDSGQIVDSVNARTLCRQIITGHLYD